MASVKRRPDGVWRARYRDEAGKEHAKHFARKTDAQAWLDKVTAAVVRGDYVDPKAGKVTVAAYAATWEAVQVSSEGTRRIVDNALRLHLVPALGTFPMASVRPTQVQGFVKALEATLSPGSVRNVYDVTARLFSAAVDDKLISHSPCRRIKLPKDNLDEVTIPTVEEVAAIVDAMDPRFATMVTMLCGSGLRIGELRALEVQDVDFLRRTVTVTKQRLQSGTVAPLKSKASRRVVPVGQVVIDALAAHLAKESIDPLAVEGSVDPSSPLFADELGNSVNYSRWKKLLAAACAEAGVEVTAHSFRHFAASALIAGGASVKQVQTFLGHASAVITLRTYAHLFPGDEDRTRNVLDAALSPLADSLRTEAASRG